MERRTSTRVPTRLKRTCRVPATPQEILVLDISSTGCRAKLTNCAIPGSTIHVDLAPGVRFSGEVVWSSGQLAGIRFDRRLTTRQAIELGVQLGPAAPVASSCATTPRERGGLQHWVRKVFGLQIAKAKPSPVRRR